MRPNERTNQISLIAVSALLILASRLPAADNPCEPLLREGLYERLEIKKGDSFDLDMRTYFLSNRFTDDMKKGSWGTQVDLIADDIPIQLAANSDESERKVFREKIEKSKSVRVSQASSIYVLKLKPNDDLAKRFNDCMTIINPPFGFHVEDPIVVDDQIIFKISFTPISITDELPKIRVPIRVVNATLLTTDLAPGTKMPQRITLNAQRDPNREAVLVLETDKGIVTELVPAVAKRQVSQDMPIGTVITSFLNWKQFAEATKCNDMNPGKDWRANSSKWCPADGREVPGSLYSDVTSMLRVPDLRGMFLRGINTMDPTPPQSVSKLAEDRKDAQDRPIGDYQADALKEHTHQIPNDLVFAEMGGLKGGGGGEFIHRQNTTTTTTSPSGPETRPKNMAVVYYIRVN